MLKKRVSENFNKLNNTDLYIWNYIYENKEKCVNSSLKELCETLNISHTSLLRFTEKIGLEGFTELRYLIKFELEEKSSFDNLIFSQIITEYSNTLHYMRNINIDSQMSWIHESERVFVVTTGRAQKSAAQELCREFAYSKKIFHPLDDLVIIDTVLENATSKDLFIIFSYSGNNKISTNLLKFLNRKKIKSIGICSNPKSYLAENCNFCFTFQSTDYNLNNQAFIYSSSIPFFLISNMLFLKYLEYTSNLDVY